ncbi:unnamed protein product [Gadus morhua 'NCC']
MHFDRGRLEMQLKMIGDVFGTSPEGAKGRIGKVPLNANGRHLCTRPFRPRTPKLDSATSPGNGSTARVETHVAMFTVSVAPSLTPVPGSSEEWDVILRKHLGHGTATPISNSSSFNRTTRFVSSSSFFTSKWQVISFSFKEISFSLNEEEISASQ